MKTYIVDDPVEWIKQYIIQNFDDIFPIAIIPIDRIQLRIPLEIYNELTVEEQKYLREHKGYGTYAIVCDITNIEAFAIYQKDYFYDMYDGIMGLAKLFVVKSGSINDLTRKCIENGWIDCLC